MSTKIPASLGRRGRAFWRAVLHDFDLDSWELPALEEACSALDRLEAIRTELEGAPQTVMNAKGDQVVHPLITEQRMLSQAYARLVASLRLPAADGVAPQRRGGFREPYGSSSLQAVR